MADQSHLKTLKQSEHGAFLVWNEWRRQNPSIRPDLSGADLTRMDLTW
jgi:hypothetical protein